MKLNNNDDSHNSGLNLLIYNMLLDIESHPAWVCGLKLIIISRITILQFVTPCVGVWIETSDWFTRTVPVNVTPCVGVWIETLRKAAISWKVKSHPAWVCGLKLLLLLPTIRLLLVTPCVGVWIETD